MKQRIIQSGHSLAVTIPNSFVKTVGVRKGDEVRVEKRVSRGSLTLYFKGAQQLSLTEKVLQSQRKNL